MSQIDSYIFASYVKSCKKILVNGLKQVSNANNLDALNLGSLVSLSNSYLSAIKPNTDLVKYDMHDANYVLEPFFAQLNTEMKNDELRTVNGGSYPGCAYYIFDTRYDTLGIPTNVLSSNNKEVLIKTSDGQTFTKTAMTSFIITWDKSKDLELSTGEKVRWVKVYYKTYPYLNGYAGYSFIPGYASSSITSSQSNAGSLIGMIKRDGNITMNFGSSSSGEGVDFRYYAKNLRWLIQGNTNDSSYAQSLSYNTYGGCNLPSLEYWEEDGATSITFSKNSGWSLPSLVAGSLFDSNIPVIFKVGGSYPMPSFGLRPLIMSLYSNWRLDIDATLTAPFYTNIAVSLPEITWNGSTLMVS